MHKPTNPHRNGPIEQHRHDGRPWHDRAAENHKQLLNEGAAWRKEDVMNIMQLNDF